MINPSVKLHDVVFLVAGIGILFSLPFLHDANFAPWLAFKMFFFVGFVFYFLKR